MRKSLAFLFTALLLASAFLSQFKPASGDLALDGSWMEMAPMHFARGGLGVAVVNDKIYAIGGNDAHAFGGGDYNPPDYFTGGIVGYNEQYDPSTNKWVMKVPMPTPRTGFAIAVCGSRIYCMGGYGVNGSTSVNEVYDPSTDTWETKASIPIQTGTREIQAAVLEDKIYVIGGSLHGNLNQVYDPQTDSWTTKAYVPTQDYGMGAVAGPPIVFRNQLYVFGYNVSTYDSAKDSWDSKSPQPPTYLGGYPVVTTGRLAPECIYLFGSGKLYYPQNNSWSLGAALPISREFFGVANVNDQLFAIGGKIVDFGVGGSLKDEAPFANTERYTPVGYGTPDLVYVLEHVPPNITLYSPQNITYDGSEVSIEISVNKPTNWTGYSLDGQQNITFTGNITLTGLSSRQHTLVVYANDTYGNMGVSEKVAFSVPEPFPFLFVGIIGVVITFAVILLLVYIKKK
ncbi:MAG: Kelch repeat-containing protein [Candidatus Bathyarchaeia archaeon]|jgi:hypothetical protein